MSLYDPDPLSFVEAPKYKAFVAWRNAKLRCYDADDPRYYTHGGRGIRICDEWKNCFNAFYEHIGVPVTQSLILDRIDNDGHYEPGNIRWTNVYVSQLNKNLYRNNTSGVKGLSFNRAMSRWDVSRKIFGTLYRKTFKDIDDAMDYWHELEAMVQTRLCEQEGK